MSSSLPGSFEPDHDNLIAHFMSAHGVDLEEATTWLSASEWNIDRASEAYQVHTADAEAQSSDADTDPTAAGGSSATNAGQARSGGPSSSRPKQPPGTNKKFATLGDLGGSASQGGDDDDDDDDDEQDLFAGGEKSGLAVQNPDDLKKKILEKARRNAERPFQDDQRAQPPSNFRGTARTLGGDDAPSRVIPDAEARIPPMQGHGAERVERRLHFWSNGFSVDDGELYDTSDPRNAHILSMIRSGRAPLDIMDVTQDQEVDVKVEQHDGPYVAPKRKFKPFSGAGQRLGSPTPGVSGTASSSAAPAAPVAAASSGTAAPGVDVDSSVPVVSIQVRLGDGTRLVSRFNLTHTVGDLYEFVNRSSAASAGRQYALMTTFPSKELTDKEATLEDTEELKKGGSVVQKWL